MSRLWTTALLCGWLSGCATVEPEPEARVITLHDPHAETVDILDRYGALWRCQVYRKAACEMIIPPLDEGTVPAGKVLWL